MLLTMGQSSRRCAELPEKRVLCNVQLGFNYSFEPTYLTAA